MRCPLIRYRLFLSGRRASPYLILAVRKLFQCKMYSNHKCSTQLLSKDSIVSLRALSKLSHSSQPNSPYLYHQNSSNLDRSSLNSRTMTLETMTTKTKILQKSTQMQQREYRPYPRVGLTE